MPSKLAVSFFSAGAHVALGALLLCLLEAQPEKQEKNATTVALVLAEKQQAASEMPFSLPAKKSAALKVQHPKKTAPLVKDFFEHASGAHAGEEGAKAEGTAQAPRRPKPLLLNGDAVRVTYPPKARHLKIEGSVHLRLVVAASGDVKEAAIVSGPAFGLTQAAVSLAKKLRFLPATDEDGNAVVSEISHEVIFRLN